MGPKLLDACSAGWGAGRSPIPALALADPWPALAAACVGETGLSPRINLPSLELLTSYGNRRGEDWRCHLNVPNSKIRLSAVSTNPNEQVTYEIA